MPAYVPPHLRRPKPKANNTTRKVKFVGNATGNTDIEPDIGVRYIPQRNAAATRKILKHVRHTSKNVEPPAKPTTIIYHMPPAFRNEIFRKKAYLHTKKVKKAKKVKAVL